MIALHDLPSTRPETPALVRDGLFLIAIHRGGVRARRLRADRPTTVGRSPDCDLVLDSAHLAPVHFSVSHGPPHLVFDSRSPGGTRVNGQPVDPDSPVAIDAKSVLEASGVLFVLRTELPHDVQHVDAVALNDEPMARVHAMVERVARAHLAVLVTGETGVGKEIISRTIHDRSTRAEGPFLALNCAALPEALLESELFGHERGAFTGAVQNKPGLIEEADGGTLFLDEVGELPLATQAKLLRVLETGELARVGALRPRRVDVRVVAATNRDLAAEVARGSFRADLFFRLNGITIRVPPLRERRSEILPLAALFVRAAAERAGVRAPTIAPEVASMLEDYAWPGNVRELRNVMERAFTLGAGSLIRLSHVVLDPCVDSRAPAAAPVSQGEHPPSGPLLRVSAGVERRRIEEALARTGGHQGRAAELLSMSRRSLLRRLDEYGFMRPRKKVG